MLGVNFIYLHVACRSQSISNEAFYQNKKKNDFKKRNKNNVSRQSTDKRISLS